MRVTEELNCKNINSCICLHIVASLAANKSAAFYGPQLLLVQPPEKNKVALKKAALSHIGK